MYQFNETRQVSLTFSKYSQNNLDKIEVSVLAWPSASIPFVRVAPFPKLTALHQAVVSMREVPAGQRDIEV